jgi:1,4-dihydroxy-2-naphthoyl-CoA hydrolase
MNFKELKSEEWQELGKTALPGHLKIKVHEVKEGFSRVSISIEDFHFAPNGYVHAGTIVSIADTACGYGCLASLPVGASGFTTIETKSNHLGSASSGVIEVVATAQHLGKSTQVWDAVATHNGKTIALFRCTQMVLWPK